MTAVKSSNSGKFFGKRFLNDINGNKKQLIVNSILQLLGLPVISVIALITVYVESADLEAAAENAIEAGCIPFVFIGIAAICVSILMGIVIALFHFSYLYRKTIVDMNYSLPLSGTQRFFADYLSGLAIYMVPVIAAIALSFAILGVGSIFIDASEIWHTVPRVLKMGFIVLVGMVQLYTISVFAISFCGSTFEAIFGIIAFICMIPATIGCVWLAIIETSTYGIVSNAIFMKNVFSSTSPFGTLCFFVNYSSEYLYSGDLQHYTSMYTKWMIITILFTILYMMAAYLLCRYRKAEDVSKPYVYKAFFYGIMSMAVFTVLSLFITFNGFVIAGIVICAVGWFIMEVITRRGFKKFWTAPIGFAIAVVSVFGICGICKVTDGFGSSKHIPSAATVESIEISDFLNGSPLSFRDKDVIKAAIEVNKEVVDRHFNPDSYTYNSISSNNVNSDFYCDVTLELSYSTITGSTIMRSYQLPSGMTDDLVTAILLSDEYAEYSSSQIGHHVFDEYTVSKYVSVTVSDSLHGTEKSQYFNADEMYYLKKAYAEDMKNMTREELLNGDVYCYIDDMWVLESFENTKNFLAQHDVEIKPISSDSVNIVYIVKDPVFLTDAKYYFEKNDDRNLLDFGYYDNDWDDENTSSADKITSVYPDYYYGSPDDDYYRWYGAEKEYILDILSNCTPIIIGEKPIAVIIINSHKLYLHDTAENRELIEKANIKTSIKSDNTSSPIEQIPFNTGSADDMEL